MTRINAPARWSLINPCVGIIMPVLNMAGSINQSIESIQRQSHSDWELIVVDDGSTDGTWEILESLNRDDPRIRIFRNRYQPGTGNARNFGLDQTQSRFLAFLDADDLWLPRKLELQMNTMLSHSMGFSYTSFLLMNNSGSVVAFTRPQASSTDFRALLRSRPIATSSVMIDRKYYGSPRFPNLRRAQDLACWLQLLKNKGSAYWIQHDEASLIYRVDKKRGLLTKSINGFMYSNRIYKHTFHLGFCERWGCLATYALKNFKQKIVARFQKFKFTSIQDSSDPHFAFLTTRIPYPTIGGDQLREHHMLAGLSLAGRVRVICLTLEPIPAMTLLQFLWDGHDLVVYQMSSAACILRAARAIFSRTPIQVAMFQSPNANKYIRPHLRIAKGVLAMLIRTAPIALESAGRLVLDLTDSIGLHYQEALSRSKSIFWSLIYRLDGPRLLSMERRMIERFDFTFLVNLNECHFFDEPAKVRWIPNGTNTELLSRPIHTGPTELRVCFLGKLGYQPDEEACLWFINKVLPKLPDQLTFMIIGSAPSPRLVRAARYSGGRVVLTGFLIDPFEKMSCSLAVVAPIHTGGDVQNKILDAMALGCPVLTSTKAASAIGATNFPGCLLAINTPEEYVEAIGKAMSNPEFLIPVRTRARTFIQQHISWTEIHSQVAQIFR